MDRSNSFSRIHEAFTTTAPNRALPQYLREPDRTMRGEMRRPVYNRNRAMSERRYTVLFEPAEEGGYVATCPALPGLVTEGDSLDQAREMVRDAIRGYLESLRTDGLPAPDDIKLFDDPVKEEM